MRSLGSTLLVALLIFFHASIASAADAKARATLIYSATDSACPDEASFRDQVAARLGYDPFVEKSTHELSVTITFKNGHFVGSEVLVNDGDATPPRELTAKIGQCGALVTALARGHDDHRQRRQRTKRRHGC